MIPSKKRVLPSLVLLLLIALIGVIGYCILEGWSVLDSMYMVVITLFTVGFKEVQDNVKYFSHI